MSIHFRQQLSSSELVTQFRIWNAIQVVIDSVDEQSFIFEMLLEDEVLVGERVLSENAQSKIEEDMQLFVLATNDMIGMSGQQYDMLKDRVSDRSSSSVDIMPGEMDVWSDLMASIIEDE